MDDLNPHWAWLHALTRDCPGKTFWNATAMHPAIFRALRMDKSEDGAIFAAAAFRLHRSDEGATVLLALPALRILEDGDDDWLSIETVIAWDPRTDTAAILGDTGSQWAGHISDADSLDIFASPFAYFRHVAEQRAQWFIHRQAVNGEWRVAQEPAHVPGVLAIGPTERIRWPIRDLPDEIRLHGIPAKTFNNTLLRQARIPRAVEARSQFKAAA